MQKNQTLKKLMIVTVMIALDIVLSPIMRVEGMAPMSSVMNIIAAVLLGPFWAVVMATITGIMRMMIYGVPPLALTGAIFGAFCAGLCYRLLPKWPSAMFGEFIGTGIIGSLLSVPVMAWVTGQHNQLNWLLFTPRFVGATIIGSVIAYFILLSLSKIDLFKDVQALFRKF
ncbi:energy coupling factor transporter S component ThiW [Eupransor demetentiae]|uniref:Membrane (S) component ThiW (ThiW) n=1 Tax=Eupransor demetentiae TaxID=3109584 RepID=A0ABP0EPI8_9LACO|nr:ECF-type thiazole transporter [Lactobacillaceae bacterium LMG 33000]